jgi:hypothetical protein
MSWQSQIKNLAMAVAVLSSAWMALTVGIGEAATLVLEGHVVDPVSGSNLAQDTLDAVGGSVDFVDRIAVLGVFTTLLGAAGLGVITRSKNNPQAINTILAYMPMIVGFIAFSAFGTEAWELISGDRDWAASGDGYNSYILFLASSMVAAIVGLFRN